MSARLETYVEELRHELRDLPVATRAQELAEVRSHLEQLKVANVELGLTEEEAEAAAVSQFGGANELGKSVQKAHWRDQWDSLPGVAWSFSTLCWLSSVLVMQKGRIVEWPREWSATAEYIVVLLSLGVLLDRIFPKYAVRGILFSFAVTILSEVIFSTFIESQTIFFLPFHGPQLVLFGGVVLSFSSRRFRRQRTGLVSS